MSSGSRVKFKLNLPFGNEEAFLKWFEIQHVAIQIYEVTRIIIILKKKMNK